MKHLICLIKNEQGQGLSEYSLVLGIIAVAVIATIAILSENAVKMLTNTLKTLASNEG
jgi:pilus assembly protein Flp/PilA